MKIVFDAYWWISGPPSLRHVVRETVLGWRDRFPEDELVVVVPSRDAAAARLELSPGITVRATRVWPQALAAVVACRREGRRLDADAVFVQNFAAGGRRFGVVFLHDVLFVTHPEWFSIPERVYFAFMPRRARLADLVLTSSATEAARIRANSAAQVVVPVGIGMSTELAAAEPIAITSLVPGRFVLTVGRLNVRKNLGPTIEAALTSGRIDADRPLVVVGSADGKGQRLPERVAAAVRAGAVIFTGFVDDARLRWLYSNTALFLFLSLGEGFGMPPHEALYFGAPVIVSDIDVFRETMPANVTRVDPRDVAAIAIAIRARIDGGCESPTEATVTDHSWAETVDAMHAAVVAGVAGRAFTGRSSGGGRRRSRPSARRLGPVPPRGTRASGARRDR